MGFRFNKRVKILPGVTLNVGKKGVSTSIGVKGARVNIGKNGIRTTVGIPGTGISYSDYKKYGDKNQEIKQNKIQYQLPEGVVIPKYKMKFTGFYIGIGSLLLSFINVLFLLPAFVGFLIQLFVMAFSKRFRNAYYTQSAMINFKKGNWNKCVWYCNRALKINPNNESAKKLIDEIYRMHNVTSTV